MRGRERIEQSGPVRVRSPRVRPEWCNDPGGHRAGRSSLVAALVAPTAGAPEPAPPSSANVERHHYSIAARVRPLLLFWIGRSGVGDAVVTKRRGPSETAYSLLIGSDPERAPRRINRWGYIDEEIHGRRARR